MENASKALIMAGSVLLAIIVISVLTIFFDNLRQVAQTQENAKVGTSVEELNAQYEVYSRNVYGTELFSLANKIISYNEIQAARKDGYEEEPIHLNIVLTKEINSVFKAGTYNEYKWRDALEELNKNISDLGKLRYKSPVTGEVRKLSVIATMRSNDLADLEFTDYTPQYKADSKNPFHSCKLGEALSKYKSYKTDLNNIKENGYKYIGFDYWDNTSGRIRQLNYER